MKSGGGKAKGSSFEREVCVALSRWVTQGERKDVFWRSAMSGGRASVHTVGDVRQCGDICAVAPEGGPLVEKYYIECKHLQSIDIHGLLTGKGKLLSIWWDTIKQAAKHKREPMLIARENRLPTILCVPCGAMHCTPKPLFSSERYDMITFLFDEVLSVQWSPKLWLS